MATVVYARRLMGTDFELKFDAPRDGLVDQLFAIGDELEAELSVYREQSAVSRLARTRVGETFEMPEHLRTLVRLSQHFEERTQGYFRPAGAKLLDAFETHGVSIQKKREDSKLDFGAIGKGYALDLWASVLVRAGVETFLISAGGSSILARGVWNVSWAVDRGPDGELTGFALHPIRAIESPTRIWALGVSGILEKGQHIWADSPVVDEPCPGKKSAIVASSRATDADALSTALFAGASLGEIPHAWIEKDGNLFWNEPFGRAFLLTTKGGLHDDVVTFGAA